MGRFPNRWPAWTLVVVAAGGCLFPTDTCACVYPPPHLIWVSGTVSTGAGAAAPSGTFVRAAAYEGPCPVIAPGVPDGATQASVDLTGRFRVDLRWPTPVSDVCVRVRAFRRIGDDAPVTVERTGLRIGLGADGRPLDSLRVAMVLP